MDYINMKVVPITLRDANEFVKEFHRHHKQTVGHKFSIAVSDEEGIIRGVAIAGRPVARHFDDGLTIEVNRVCTDGTKNACSMLYQAVWRAAKEMGYIRAITYTLPSEGGSSLKGAGWKLVGEAGGGSWNSKSRTRKNPSEYLMCKKHLWENRR